MIVEPSKRAFLQAWPGGYGENWEVYGKVSGVSEEALVSKCLAPFFDQTHTAMEIGCGIGFWVKKYLCPNFMNVIGLDLLPSAPVLLPNFKYIEVPERNYDCFGVDDGSVDFVWSFGCFCHLTLPSVQQYLCSAFRKLRPGGRASLFFSNSDRRPGTASVSNTEDQIIWSANDWPTTKGMMEEAGFVGVRDIMPELCDTMAYGEKRCDNL